ncbi:hypothetical protein [Rhizobium sp. NXC24]|uniref:hypothetical protein n=1 Tax=Rhizobium sp. NXC24 TaxID=2048897 RepID=UPI00131A50A2|nr:hypothetical protein [Rhizobium sp. NXC24]
MTTQDGDVEKFQELIKSVPYPLFISAAFMGLTHEAIPGFSKIANLQRDIFHDLVGVPRIVANTATDFSTELWDKLETNQQRAAELSNWTKLNWRNKIRPYADITFYEAEISRRADALENLSTSSEKDLKSLLEQLVYVASIATVRKGGGIALRRLARDLGVHEPPSMNLPIRGLVAGALLSLVALTILWFAIPLLGPVVDWLNGPPPLEYWPHGEDELTISGLYLLAQAIPVLLAVTILVISLSPSAGTEMENITFRGIFEKHAVLLLSITIVVFLFDYIQMMSDYGMYNNVITTSFWIFIARWIPYNVLHAIISMSVCIVILNYVIRGQTKTAGVSIKYIIAMIVSVAALSCFYAIVRLRFDFHQSIAIDYILIISFLNISASVIALYLCQCICHRRLKKSAQSAERRQLSAATQ